MYPKTAWCNADRHLSVKAKTDKILVLLTFRENPHMVITGTALVGKSTNIIVTITTFTFITIINKLITILIKSVLLLILLFRNTVCY